VSSAPDRNPIPVFVLSGFLGSGKSTLLNELMTMQQFAASAMVINEFGDVALDHDLVVAGKPELTVTTTGCICCTAGSDIRASLFELHEARRTENAPAFDRVIVETTGLADLAPVINQIIPGGAPASGYRDHIVARAFRLAGVITLVDAIHADANLDEHFECVKQVAFADCLVISKSDLMKDPASRGELAALRDRLRHINPAADILDRNDPSFRFDLAFHPRNYAVADRSGDVHGWLALERILAADSTPNDSAHGAGRAGGGIETVTLIADKPIARRDYKTFLSLLHLAAGPRLLRMKGLIAFDDDPEHPWAIHAVQHSVHPSRRLDAWPTSDRRTRIVAIVHGIDPDRFREMFRQLTGNASRPAHAAPLAVALVCLIVVTATALAGIAWAASSLVREPSNHSVNARDLTPIANTVPSERTGQ